MTFFYSSPQKKRIRTASLLLKHLEDVALVAIQAQSESQTNSKDFLDTVTPNIGNLNTFLSPKDVSSILLHCNIQEFSILPHLSYVKSHAWNDGKCRITFQSHFVISRSYSRYDIKSWQMTMQIFNQFLHAILDEMVLAINFRNSF